MVNVLNPNASCKAEHIGEGGFPLLVIDNVLKEPDKLRQLASESAKFDTDDSDFYPGLRASLPQDYADAFSLQITPLLQQAMGMANLSLECLFHAFSLTITPPEQLKPIQCIPHFDDENPMKLAVVLYLFEEDLGGTSFYRHNKTGFEAVTSQNAAGYMKTLMSQATTEGLPAADYINGDSRLFTRYHSVAARYNRCIVYPCNMLHSGNINVQQGLSADPLIGRLTMNMALLIS